MAKQTVGASASAALPEETAGSQAAELVAERAVPSVSRRNVIAAGLAGVAGLIVGSLARPLGARATSELPVYMGAANDAGVTNTSLTTASTGTALLVTQTGAGTALRGSATAVNGIAGFFTSANGSGVSGVTANGAKYGVYGGNDAAAEGGGAAVRADGKQNHALVATTANIAVSAIKASNSAAGTYPASGPTIQGLAAQGVPADAHPSSTYYRAAGEFCGPNGLIGAASIDQDDGYGVTGLSAGSAGIGVLGRALSLTGATTGVFGVVDGDSGSGVLGRATNGVGSSNGVLGISEGANGTGVYGSAISPSGATYGVYGYVSSSGGYALYGVGKGAVTGNFSKAGGSFKIDHPLDPANKYLLHSFVESPDMMNVYNGIATLDAAGEATVTLPDWFEALNRDFRYQLTSIGEFSPVFVKSEVNANKFSIGGGRAGQRVSWQLTGIRQDAWANAHRIEVEEAKPADEKGLYLHPAEHNQPESMGLARPASVPAGMRSQQARR